MLYFYMGGDSMCEVIYVVNDDIDDIASDVIIALGGGSPIDQNTSRGCDVKVTPR